MIKTRFGNAYKRKDGYYQISSGVNQGKLLHRLVYEDEYGPIPTGFIVHHINGDKENNNPSNLMLLTKSNHHHLHTHGVNHPRWDNGRIDSFGGLEFVSASKNKGMNMQDIADTVGYSNVSSIFHYLDKRGLKWNQI
ncbi:HNH endonuclease signature motif containing protein [Methanobrevibacter sp.]|uniref:HNH endonuclease signature motif containing protein n=1 Tax=Methanobrevibacter sp. TaxID=66852 RepID=UPI00386C4760